MILPLSPEALARLKAMEATGNYIGATIEPELMRKGLVRIYVRSQYGTRWDLTDKGREVLKAAR